MLLIGELLQILHSDVFSETMIECLHLGLAFAEDSIDDSHR